MINDVNEKKDNRYLVNYSGIFKLLKFHVLLVFSHLKYSVIYWRIQQYFLRFLIYKNGDHLAYNDHD